VALSDAQQSQIRSLLGYPDVNRENYWRLNGAMTAISAEGEARVGELLTRLAAVEDRLDASLEQLHVSRVEDVHFAGAAGQASLHRQGARLTRQLAALLGVPVREGAPFGSGARVGIAGRG
jgi:hypothetical protein